MIAVQSAGGDVSEKVTYLPDSYKEGSQVCNIFYSGDCVTVSGGIQVDLKGGEAKAYLPADHAYFSDPEVLELIIQ